MPYFPPGHPDMGYLRHIVLLYSSRKGEWNPERLRPYVAHLDPAGAPTDWLFDSFLFTPPVAPSGNAFIADWNRGTSMSGEGDFYAIPFPNAARKQDNEELLEIYFGEGGYLDALNEAVERAGQVLPASAHKRNVVLLVPYPVITQANWGKLPGSSRSLNFSTLGQNLMKATQDRLAAVTWFVTEALARWNPEHWPHVNLLGFYWPFETVYRGWEVDDHWLLKEFHTFLRGLGKKLLWIPFTASYNTHLLDDYQAYYFDLAFNQPNHMFYVNTPGIEGPANVARARNAGFEMEYFFELDEPIATSPERNARFRDYLNGGVTYGYMTESAVAWFHGPDGIERMYGSPDPQERAFYEEIYAFIKGTYQLKPGGSGVR